MSRFKEHPLYRKHDIDSAMDALWGFYKSRFVPLFLISLVLSAITQYATLFLDIKGLQEMAADPASISDPTQILDKLKSMIIPLMGLMLVSLLFSTILHYYILYKPLDEGCNIFNCALRSLRYFLPYLVIMILLAFVGAFVLMLGFLVLFIGILFSALYIGMVSFFILPVLIAENADIGSAITRTLALSHKGFWANMGWTAVFIILLLIISLVLSGLVMIPFAGSFFKVLSNPQEAVKVMDMTTNPWFLFFSSVINALTLPLYPIFSFILYFNRVAREEDHATLNRQDDAPQRVRVEDLYAKPRTEEDNSKTE
ncbi:MAG: hypothetical protein U0X39_10695 [Bacteroidales bacterium]